MLPDARLQGLASLMNLLTGFAPVLANAARAPR